MPTKKSETAEPVHKLVRRRLVGIAFGPHSIAGRYEEVWETMTSWELRTVLTYGRNVSFFDNPEIAASARAASILMAELSNAVCNADRETKPEL